MRLRPDKRLVQEADSASTTKSLSEAVSRAPEELAKIVSLFASSDGWMDKVRLAGC